jgi:hypothetical protein
MKKGDVRVNGQKRYGSSSRGLIKISKIRGRMDPRLPLVMKIVILLDWRMESLLWFIGPKDSHPKFN